MLDLVIGFVVGVVACGLGFVTIPKLVAFFKGVESKVTKTVTTPAPSVTPSTTPKVVV